MGILLNPLSALMVVIVTGVSLLVQVYSLGYMKGDPAFPRFFSYLSLFSFSMLTLVLADNFILLYMAWELVGLCSYLLIGFWYQKPEAARAAKKAFVVTRVGDLGFLIGILVLSILAGTFDFAGVARFIGAGNVPQGQVTLVVLLLFCGAVGKSGQFPLHVWLPGRHGGPDSRFRPDPFRHDGRRGRVHGGAPVRDLPGQPRRPSRRGRAWAPSPPSSPRPSPWRRTTSSGSSRTPRSASSGT